MIATVGALLSVSNRPALLCAVRGTLYFEAGDVNRAQVIWERCAVLGDADAMLGLGRQALERREPGSVEHWMLAIHTQGDAFPITALRVALARYGYTPQAVRAYQRAVDLGDAYAMEYLATILDSQGSHDEAEVLRQRAAGAERMS